MNAYNLQQRQQPQQQKKEQTKTGMDHLKIIGFLHTSVLWARSLVGMNWNGSIEAKGTNLTFVPAENLVQRSQINFKQENPKTERYVAFINSKGVLSLFVVVVAACFLNKLSMQQHRCLKSLSVYVL